MTAILARRLSTDAFGQYVYSQWLIDIGFLVCSLGATGVISRYLAEYRNESPMLVAIIRRWRPFSFVLPIGGSFAACLGARLSGLSFDVGGYALLLCWGFCGGVWAMHTAALAGLQRFDLMFRANLISALIMLGAASLVPFTAGNVDPVFAIMAAAAAFASMVGMKAITTVSQGSVGSLNVDQTRAIYRYGINIWITALLWNLVWSRGEIPMIRGLLGDEGVARYGVALTLYGGAVAGVMLGVGGIAPQITRYWGEGNQQAAISLCRQAMDFQLLVSGLCAMALIWLAPELMQVGFGERYIDSAPLLSVLALGLPALTVASHNHLLQIITGARYNRDTTLLGVFLLLGFSWAGVSLLGVTGAAWSRAMTLLILSGISLCVCWRTWGQSSFGFGNLALVVALTTLSVISSAASALDSFWGRIAMWFALSLIIAVFVKNQSQEPVVLFIVRFLNGRLCISK